MAASFNGDFARLVPYNHLAQMLFSETVAYVDKNDTFHLQFINRTVTEPFRKSSEPVEESTEYDTYDTDTETSRFKNIQHSGHFVLSFTAERAPEMPHLGWRVGKGTGKMSVNRGVDLLLAKPGDILSKSLASIHLLLLFNPKSGFLMLKGASTKAIVEFKTGGMWEKLEYGEQRLMHQHATMLRAGACEYELGYIIEEKQRRSYFKERDAFLERIHPNKNYVPPSFQKLPGDSCVQKGNYIEFGTQGSGGFGWITQGVDIKAGNPVAIKELRVNNHRSHLAAMAEVNMGRRFSVSRNRPSPHRYLTHRRRIEVFCIFWMQGVSMAVRTAAVKRKGSIFTCLSHVPISLSTSGKVWKSLGVPNCIG